MDIICVARFDQVFEANLCKGMLENEGIECFLTNENITNLFPYYNGIMGAGIQLMVDENDYEKAHKLINPATKSDKILCPNCNSDNVVLGLGRNKYKKILLAIVSLFAFVPIGKTINHYCCKDCKTEF